MIDTYQDKVAIIGAATTGLITAIALLNQGYSPDKIEINEAANRAGGRIETISMLGHAMDTGPHWLHGGWGNGFYKLLKNIFGNKIDDMVILDDARNTIIITDEGIYGPKFRDDKFQELENQYDIFEKDNPGKDIPLYQLAALTKNKLTIAFAKFMSHCWMGVEHSNQPGKKLLWLGFSGDPGGVGGLQFKNGMREVVDMMLAYLKEKGVEPHYGRRIVEVNQPEFNEELDVKDPCILIDSDGHKHKADQAVITASFGVHKRGGIQYNPPLSQSPGIEKEINNTMLAKLTKVIVPMRQDFFERANVRIEPNTHIYILTKDPPLFCHARSVGKPFVTIFAGADFAEKIESYSPKEVQDFVDDTFDHLALHMQEFKGWKQFQNGSPVKTEWNTNKLFQCCYTAPVADEQRLGQPLRHGRVLIAGEATAKTEESTSTLAGAVAAAIKTAQSIIAYGKYRLLPRANNKSSIDNSGVSGPVLGC